MALGSKGNNGSSNSSRGRPYGMMLLLAFGAAVLGVMVLHKLRERRIFTLLIQDKDQHLMNLHLLLQKERDSTKEIKRKLEDLKAKYVLVRTEKQAMKSITTSLKQEQRSLETKLVEKQNEINMLRKNEIHSTSENSQIQALKEILKQKEEEIEEMKHLLEKQTTVWSVSTDDPSKSPVLPVVSDKDAGSLDDSRNLMGDSELNKIYGSNIHKLEKEDGEDLGQMDNAGEKNIEKSRSNVSVDDKLMMDNKNKTEVTSITSHRDDTEGKGGGLMAMNGKEHGMKMQVPEGDEGRLHGKMFKYSKDGRKLKKLNRSGMIVGSNGGGRLDQNYIANKDRDNGSRTEHAGSDRNTFAVDDFSSAVYGKTNFKIFKHYKDEGFRRSSDKNDTVHFKETVEGAISNEGISYTKHNEIGRQKSEKRQQLGTGDEFISNGKDLESQQNSGSRDGSSEFSSNDSGGHQEGNDTNAIEKEPVEVLTQQEGNSTYGTQQQEKAVGDGAARKEVDHL